MLGKSTPDIVQYGLRNLDEFMATCMTEPEMQQVLAGVRYHGSLLERFIRAVHKVLQMLSVNADTNSLAYHAVERTLRVIEESNRPPASTQRIADSVNSLQVAQVGQTISDAQNAVSNGQDDAIVQLDDEGDTVVHLGAPLHGTKPC